MEIEKIKRELSQEVESKIQEFNQLKVAFGTKSDLNMVTSYLYNFAQWDAKDIIYLESTYKNFKNAYVNAKNDNDIVSIDYVDVDCLFNHLEKEKSTDEVRSKGVKGATLPVFKNDEKGNVILDGNNSPTLENTFTIGYLKMLVANANKETSILRLEFQSISDQIKMCDTYHQYVLIGEKPQNTFEVALKDIKLKYKKLIEEEKEKNGKTN
jgi:hypothetical protein